MPTRRAGRSPDVRGLGWRLDPEEWGDWPDDTLWHTGFTGTSLWIDPVTDTYIILLTNAVNMAPNNSTIVLTAHQSGNQLRFSIEDEGAGVSSDEQDSFFDSTDNPLIHFISDDCGEENDLALCRRIVTAHGGMISMRNRAKVGTRFEFSIPTVMPLNADSVSNVA